MTTESARYGRSSPVSGSQLPRGRATVTTDSRYRVFLSRRPLLSDWFIA